MMLLRRAYRAPQRAAVLRHAADALVCHHLHLSRAAPLCSAATPSSRMPRFSEVKRAASLAQIYKENTTLISSEEASSFWSALGRLSARDPSQQRWIRHHHDVFDEVREHTRTLMPQMSPTELTRSLYGAFLAGMDVRPTWSAWWADAGRYIISGLKDLNIKQMSVLLQSFHRLKPPPEQLFEAVVREIETRDLSELTALDMCSLSLRIGNLDNPSKPLMSKLATAAAPWLHSLEPKLLVMLCSSVSKVGPDAPLFYSGLTEQLPLRLPNMEPRPAAIILQACMYMDWMPMPAKIKLLDTFVEDAGGRLELFDANALSCMLQGVSRAPFDVPHNPETLALISRLIDVCTYRIEDFKPTELVNIARATATIKEKHKIRSPADFYRALSLQAAKHLHALSSFEITGLIWAYAKAGVWSYSLFGPLMKHITPKLHLFNKLSLLTLSWACLRLQINSPEFTNAIFEAIQRRGNEFTPAELQRAEENLKLPTTPGLPRAASQDEELY